MALDDYESQACLCYWVNQLGETPKKQLKEFVQAATALIATAKTVYVLINTDYEDLFKKQAAEALLKVYQQATAPIEMKLSMLVNLTAPAADCPPVAQIASVMRNVRNTIMKPINEFEFEVEQLIDSIDESTSKIEFFDMLINSLNDIVDAIEQC